MKIRNAFTMIELIFVIVVMGIIGKFGTEFLAQAYKSFIFSNVNNGLQAKSAIAVEFIASRLQYRIKDSVIARTAAGATPVAVASASGETYKVLEWVGADIDGLRGTSTPNWSGIIDLDHASSSSGLLISPATDTNATSSLINSLSYTDSSIDDAALYFIGSNSDINNYGWDGTALNTHTGVMHPIMKNANPTNLLPRQGSSLTANNLTGDVYEYYKLAWTAYAIVYTPGPAPDPNLGTLTLWYDYQPWNGENYTTNGKSAIIMEDVSTFQFMAIDSIIKIQVCAKSKLVEEYSLCKEKTVF